MSLFGEIAEPGTRTAWEDWDENAQEARPKLTWLHEVTVPAQIQTLLILEGRHIADSVSAFTKFKLQLVNVIQPVNINIYRSESATSEVFVCVLRDYNLLLASEIVDMLKVYTDISNDIIAIMTKPIVEYQAADYAGQQYIMRCVTTTKPLRVALTKKIPKLEQPNLISGVTAGVINQREINNQSAAAIICYMEHNEEYQINELQNLLKQLDFGPVGPQSNTVLNSNLYI